MAVIGACLPKCRSYGLQVGTTGTPEHLANDSATAATRGCGRERVALPHDDKLRHVEQFKYLGASCL